MRKKVTAKSIGRPIAYTSGYVSDLVIGVLFASPARTKVLDGHTQVGGGEVEQHLSGFVQQVSTKTSLYLHHALHRHTDR